MTIKGIPIPTGNPDRVCLFLENEREVKFKKRSFV